MLINLWVYISYLSISPTVFSYIGHAFKVESQVSFGESFLEQYL